MRSHDVLSSHVASPQNVVTNLYLRPTVSTCATDCELAAAGLPPLATGLMGCFEVAPGCGDSFLAECVGFGASVLPASPALGPVIGASPADAQLFAEGAYRISIGEHPHYRIPALGFRGIPVGVDARKVVETRTLPVIDIMMVHRKPGIGLAGMGVVSPPMRCFEDALDVLGS
jgi:hypothetical protein